jgi:hypothetical protein
MTSYGHTNLALERRLLGGLEALHGWLLFGLSTGRDLPLTARRLAAGARANAQRAKSVLSPSAMLGSAKASRSSMRRFRVT